MARSSARSACGLLDSTRIVQVDRIVQRDYDPSCRWQLSQSPVRTKGSLLATSSPTSATSMGELRCAGSQHAGSGRREHGPPPRDAAAAAAWRAVHGPPRRARSMSRSQRHRPHRPHGRAGPRRARPGRRRPSRRARRHLRPWPRQMLDQADVLRSDLLEAILRPPRRRPAATRGRRRGRHPSGQPCPGGWRAADGRTHHRNLPGQPSPPDPASHPQLPEGAHR